MTAKTLSVPASAPRINDMRGDPVAVPKALTSVTKRLHRQHPHSFNCSRRRHVQNRAHFATLRVSFGMPVSGLRLGSKTWSTF